VSFQFENFKIEEKLQTKSNSNLQLASASPTMTGSTGNKR